MQKSSLISKLGAVALGLGMMATIAFNVRSTESIAIPADLLPEYEQAIQQIEIHEQAMKQPTEVVNEIIRRTADRAGIKVADYPKYVFSRTCKCLQPKAEK